MPTPKYFKDESAVLTVGGLQIENRLDRVTLSGDVDLTLDAAGLQMTEILLKQLTAIKAAMDAHVAAGTLPEAVGTLAPTPAGNIFGMPKA